MLGTFLMLLITATLFSQTPMLYNKSSAIVKSPVYSSNDTQEPSKAEGLMNEIIITAERPSNTESNKTKTQHNLADYLTLIANVLIIVFLIGIGIDKILYIYKRKRKNVKRAKGPFSLPPFSSRDIKIGEDCTCQSGA
ncbi:MAG: hypothetical protein N2748_04320 [candidate division WOR-3 bacterium]|nr:hypothetical protein [candidate division WOR-3 bacterium]